MLLLRLLVSVTCHITRFSFCRSIETGVGGLFNVALIGKYRLHYLHFSPRFASLFPLQTPFGLRPKAVIYIAITPCVAFTRSL